MPVTAAPRRLPALALACALTLVAATVSAQDVATPEPSPVIVPAPAASPAPLAPGPEGTWVVAAYDAWGQGLAEPLPSSRLRVSLLEGGQLEGETACGRFNGGWSLEGEELALGVAPTGNLDCGEAKVAEAVGLSVALGAVTGWAADDLGGVELVDEAGSVRAVLGVFAAGEPVGAWDVQRYRRPDGEFVEPDPERPMSLVFTADGGVEGSSGCRLLMGAYAYDGAGITIGPVEAVGRHCDGDVRREERQLLRAIGEVVYWEQSEDTLSLRDGFDQPRVELARAAEPEE